MARSFAALALGDLLIPDEASAFLGSRHQHWISADHAIDDDRGLLVFALPTGHYFGGAAADRIARIEIGLEDGMLLSPRRHYLPRVEPRVALADVPEADDPPPRATAESFACREGRSHEMDAFPEPVYLPLRDLLAGAVSRPMPQYTVIGRRARVSGRVVLELLVAASGEVVCAGLINELPFGLAAEAGRAVRFGREAEFRRAVLLGLAAEARRAVLYWRLAPLPANIRFARGHVAFDFDLVEIQPRPY